MRLMRGAMSICNSRPSEALAVAEWREPNEKAIEKAGRGCSDNICTQRSDHEAGGFHGKPLGILNRPVWIKLMPQSV